MDRDYSVVRNSNPRSDELARGGPAPARTQSALPPDCCSAPQGKMSSADAHPSPITVVGLFQAPGKADNSHRKKYLQNNPTNQQCWKLRSHFSRLNATPLHKGHFPPYPLSLHLSPNHKAEQRDGYGSIWEIPVCPPSCTQDKWHRATSPSMGAATRQNGADSCRLNHWQPPPPQTFFRMRSHLQLLSSHSPLPDFNTKTSKTSTSFLVRLALSEAG